MEEKRILPIGSVIILKKGKKKLMITGYSHVKIDDIQKIMYDYCGEFYPEGSIDNNKFLFNDEDILEVYFEGYKTEEYENLKKDLLNLYKNKENRRN